MAVGAVSSQQVQNPSQGMAPVLQTGSKLATTQEALKDPNSKTFFHLTPGAKFIMPDGLELQFLGGRLTTNNPDIIRELEAVANKTTSQIYTQTAAVAATAAMQKKAADDASNSVGNS